MEEDEKRWLVHSFFLLLGWSTLLRKIARFGEMLKVQTTYGIYHEEILRVDTFRARELIQVFFKGV